MALLTATEITERLAALDGWALDASAIHREFVFDGFPEAVLFVSALVPEAEEADHHPDIAIHYRRVVLSYTTHSEGGLTERDFDGAAMASRVALELPHLTDFSDG